MKLPSPLSWNNPFLIIGVVVLILVFGFRGCGGKKTVVTLSPNPPATVSVLQRVESAVEAVKNRLADLAKELADLNSRVEALEKRPVPRVAGVTAKVKKPLVEPPIASVSSPPTAAVDLTPVERGLREGLGEIAEGLRQQSEPPPPPLPTEPQREAEFQQQPLNPCTSWAQDPVRHRRCRIWNQLS